MNILLDVLPPDVAAWASAHASLLGWVSVASIATFAGSLAVASWLIARLPSDYFVRSSDRLAAWPSLLRLLVGTARNVAGVVLLGAGVVMLVLPGQGMLTILLGLVLLSFPGKQALLLRLLRHPGVRTPVDRLRRRAGRDPLVLE